VKLQSDLETSVMRIGSLLFILSLLVAPPIWAQRAASSVDRSVELSLSNQTGQLRYRAPTDIGGQPNSEAFYTLFLSEGRDIVASAGLLFGTDLNLGPLHVQLGPQAYAALLNEENNDVFALSVGGQIRYDLIPSRGIAVVGSGFWSPDVLTFGQADNLTDLMARAEMRFADRVTGFVGYRWFELDLLDRQTQKLQNELFAGINWRLQ
jgi:hypothetical protein